MAEPLVGVAHSSSSSLMVRRLAPQAMFCLICASLSVSLLWYILSNGVFPYHRWRLRRAAPPAAPKIASSVAAVQTSGLRLVQDANDAVPPGCAAVRCAVFQRFNDSGGVWDLCTDGPWLARPPCLAFAIGADFAFDAEFARFHSCQMFNYHTAEHRPAALGDGLWTLGRLNDTTTGSRGGGSFKGLLGHLGASSHVVELLRVQLDASASVAAILSEAIADGSLGNVKQLLLQVPTRKHRLQQEAALALAGFCPVWPHRRLDALSEAPHSFSLSSRPPERRVTLLNCRFLPGPGGPPRFRNSPGSQIARPLEKLGLAPPLKDD